MRMFHKAAIVGTGLIGGSIALRMKEKKLAGQIIGISRSRKTVLLAKKLKAVDIATQELSALREADLVILAMPINTILAAAKKISRIIPKDCIVTDVGSTKKEIVNKLSRIFPNYAGSHPLAGSEKTGIQHANPEIFPGSLCIVTPSKKTSRRALKKIEALWKQLGSRTIRLSPEKHDQILSFTSHLPHIAAFALARTVPEKYFSFGAAGLRDTTRIAASDSKLWSEIILSNRSNMLKAISLFIREINHLKDAVRRGDLSRLAALLKQAREKRESLK